MQAGSAAASVGRRSRGPLKGAILSAAVIAALVVAPASTLAAKGGNGRNSAAAQAGASITLDQAGQTLALGSPVTFTTSIVGLKGNEWPMVYVQCTEGGSTVYGQLDYPSTTFILGGGSSPWWGIGGTATCVAYLDAYSSDSSRVLAQSEPFTAN